MGLEDLHSDEVLEYADELVELEPDDTKHPGVYVIYDGETGEPLYVGEAINVHQRLYDHHSSRAGDLRARVEEDDDLVRPTKGGDMWDWTEWAWVEIDNDSKRRSVENVVENRLEPRYPSD